MEPRAEILSAFTLESCRELAPFLERAFRSAETPRSLDFRAAFASVPRRLGGRASAQAAEPPAELAPLARPHWTLVDWVRAALIARALDAIASAEQAALILHLFEAGELGEQESVLRTLSLLPEPERFLETGLQAGRTNTLRVFEALACENPYPAAHFPELNFNQLVLKAIFMEVPVRRIEDLARRVTPELRRMAAAYASERRAAGRSVPRDAESIAANALEASHGSQVTQGSDR